jgi:hypothetical protein
MKYLKKNFSFRELSILTKVMGRIYGIKQKIQNNKFVKKISPTYCQRTFF